jgi:hypothetical protein
MNIAVMKWLLANRNVLQQVVEAARGWRKDMPYAEQWVIVDKIARILLPILDPATVTKLSVPESPVTVSAAMSVGAEVQALGVDWKLIVEVVIPIIISILQAISHTP